jgi:hypothetical protein
MPCEWTLDATEINLLPSEWTLDATEVNFRLPMERNLVVTRVVDFVMHR